MLKQNWISIFFLISKVLWHTGILYKGEEENVTIFVFFLFPDRELRLVLIILMVHNSICEVPKITQKSWDHLHFYN